MAFKKDKIKNIAIVLIAGVLLFTPIGFHFKVFVNRILSFSPSIVESNEQDKLSTYNWNLQPEEKTDLDYNLLYEKDKVVIINIWATWCPPCVAEMPSFQLLYDDYKEKVAFVFVANDEREKVKNFLLKKGYSFPVYYQKTKAPKQLETSSIPVTFIIDKKGNIVVKETGAANWNSDKTRTLLDSLLAE